MVQLNPIESNWIQLNQIELNPIVDTQLVILDWNPFFSLVLEKHTPALCGKNAEGDVAS